MALQVAYNFHGCPIPDAYCRVMEVTSSRNRGTVVVVVNWYAGAAAAQESSAIYTDMYSVPYASAFSVADAYTHLKTLPEFAGAVDV